MSGFRREVTPGWRYPGGEFMVSGVRVCSRSQYLGALLVMSGIALVLAPRLGGGGGGAGDDGGDQVSAGSFVFS